MCGRFGLEADLAQLANLFNFDPDLAPNDFAPNPEIIPTNRVLAIVSEPTAGHNRPEMFHWGIYPPTSGPVYRNARPVYNARSETVHSRQTFMQAYASRRCLIPATCFYELTHGEDGKPVPVKFHRADGTPFAMAGIWNPHPMPGGKDRRCVIITTRPNDLVEPIHQRMPVILDPSQYQEWLSIRTGPLALSKVMRPKDWPEMTHLILQPATA